MNKKMRFDVIKVKDIFKRKFWKELVVGLLDIPSDGHAPIGALFIFIGIIFAIIFIIDMIF